MPETGQHARRWGTEPAEPALVGRRLSELVEEAVRCTVDCCGASGLVAEGGSERPAAVSHPDLAPLVAVQLQSGDGPIPAALEHGEPARSPDLLREDRWPDYRALALDSGCAPASRCPSGGPASR